MTQERGFFMKTDLPTIFVHSLECGVLGAHAKEFPGEYTDSVVSMQFLRRAVNGFSYLNVMLKTKLFPENTYQLLIFLSKPMECLEAMEQSQFRTELMSQGYHKLEALSELDGQSTYHVTGEGMELLKGLRFHKIRAASDPVTEYSGQKLYLAMVAPELNQNDYCRIRTFLSTPDNAFFPRDVVMQTPEQALFCKDYPQILVAGYTQQIVGDTHIPCCPICGAVLSSTYSGSYRCPSSEYCNQKLNGRQPVMKPLKFPNLWVLNAAAVHNIYYPGQLEQKIRKVLDDVKSEYSTLSYEPWPEKDRWDFEVKLPGGTIWNLDAKDVKNPIWILRDAELQTEHWSGADRLIYVVPTQQKKGYLRAVNDNLKDKRICCLTLQQFEQSLREAVMK